MSKEPLTGALWRRAGLCCVSALQLPATQVPPTFQRLCRPLPCVAQSAGATQSLIKATRFSSLEGQASIEPKSMGLPPSAADQGMEDARGGSAKTKVMSVTCVICFWRPACFCGFSVCRLALVGLRLYPGNAGDAGGADGSCLSISTLQVGRCP